MAVRIQLRRDTAANWVSADPVLRAGEIGIETDTLKFKIGTGATWTATPNYANVTPSGLSNSLNQYILAADQGAPGGPAELNSSGDLVIPENSIILWNDADYTYSTTVTATQPTADRTITLPNNSGTVITSGDTGTVTNTMLAGSIANNKLANSSITINGFPIPLGGEAAYSTDNIQEGTTNKYFSAELAQDAAAQALANGTHTNITVSYNDNANSISLAAAPGYTDEEARDAVAGLITGSTHDGVSVAYTDSGTGAGTLAFTNTDKGSSQNIFKNIVVGATTVVADGNNDTLTFVGSNGVGALANATNDVIEFYNTGVTSLTGTANEVEVDTSTGAVIVGLPNDVTVSNNLTITGKISSVDSIQIDKTATVTPAEGELSWNATDGTLQLGLIGGNFANHIGRDIVLKVFNAQGSTIPKGSVVYLYGAQGDRPSVRLASNSSDTTSSKTIGIAAESIAASADGLIITQGMLSGLSLGSYTPGDILWLGSTPGSFTSTKPSAPNHMVFIGVVAKANNGNGMVYIKPQNGYELNELHDVAISSVANNDVLKYDSTSGNWVNTKTLSIQNLTLSGNLTVNGTTTTVNTADLIVNDPLIYIGEGNTGNSVDLGFVASFDNGTYQHAGLVRDASDNKWKLFKGVTDEPTTTVNFTQGSLDTLAVATLEGNVSGNVTGNLTGNVTGDVSGNAGTVTNGVYTTGSYSNPSWITGLAWTKISSTPTTISGYGITDGVSTGGTYSNPSWLTSLAWSKISSTPTTIAGYGITDPIVLTSETYSNPAWITSLAWSKISSTPTTLAGYGITDALLSSTAASTYAPINNPTFTGTVAGITKTMVGLGNVENTALSTWAGSTNITTLGTIATGTWSGTTIATNKGGTGLTSYAAGDIVYASATDTLAKLAKGTDGQILTLASGVPSWAAAPITLPSQTGNSGKYLTTDGTTASWGTLVVPITTGIETISSNTATTIDTNPLSGFTSIEYMVSLKQGSKIRTSKVVLQTDGTSVDMTEFAITETGGTMSGVVVSAAVSSTNAVLQVTVTDASSTNVTVKFSKVKL